MADIIGVFNEQLKQACRIAGAQWAVRLRRADQAWDFVSIEPWNKKKAAALESFLQQPGAAAWLGGAFHSGRVRWQSAPDLDKALACKRLYVFPNATVKEAILVGGDTLSKETQNIFRLVALALPGQQVTQQPGGVNILPQFFEMNQGFTYDTHKMLAWVTSMAVQVVPGTASVLAVRQGDLFRVESVHPAWPALPGKELMIYEHPVLAELVAHPQAVILTDPEAAAGFLGPPALSGPVLSGLLAPIQVGNRTIGMIYVTADQAGAFGPAELQAMTQYIDRIAHAVENSIILADISRYLQQFALLNEMASAASVGTDTDEVARRVVRSLRRVFHTDRVAIFRLVDNGQSLREYGSLLQNETRAVRLGASLLGYSVDTGLPIRVGNISAPAKASGGVEPVRSSLVVPLKYQSNVIGAIQVESLQLNAFTVQDEQLLVVIASHLAAMLENIRLHQETRERARNLELIHQVIQRVVGLEGEREIASTFAELMADYFGYEFAIVLVSDERQASLVHLGVGGTLAGAIQPGFKIPVSQGIVGKVFRTGVSYVSNDVSSDPDYLPIHNWVAGSELCVPLKEGDHRIGVINLEFSQKGVFSSNDLIILESLAGILSSVMVNARQYHELRIRVKQLQASRETALDIAGDLDRESILQRVVHRVKELADASGAALGLLEEAGGQVRVSIAEVPWNLSKLREVALEKGLMGRVAGTGEVMNIPDYNAWGGRIFPDEPVPFHAALGVPLMWKGEVLGVLVALDDRPGRVFQEEEIQTLELLAPKIAVSIRNALLYKELEERIEAQKLAEKKLLHSARLAAVGELASGVAHELNNPLTTVTGFVELSLDELPAGSPVRDDLELVLSEAHRARLVVRRLLDFARQTENVRTPVDINALIEEVYTLAQHQARTLAVSIQVALEEDLPVITADGNQIKQVLLNLIQNALQSMPGGGQLTLTTALASREAGNWITIAVQDTGEGIAAEQIDRIFEPFFTTRPVGKGTGLGLSVSYGLVADHGGFIDVSSETDHGSCFTVWLPVLGEKQDG